MSDIPRRIAVRGIVIKDSKLLCTKLKNYRRTDAHTYWCTPGGGVDDGESFMAAIEREMLEEIGIAPKVGHLLYVQQFMYDGQEQVELFFHIENADDYATIDLSKSTHGQDEIDEIEFLDPSKNNVLPKFLQTEKFDDLDTAPPKFFSYL